MSQLAAPTNLNIRVFTQPGPICDIEDVGSGSVSFPARRPEAHPTDRNPARLDKSKHVPQQITISRQIA